MLEMNYDPIGQRPSVTDHIDASEYYVPEHHPLIVQRQNHELATTVIQACFSLSGCALSLCFESVMAVTCIIYDRLGSVVVLCGM